MKIVNKNLVLDKCPLGKRLEDCKFCQMFNEPLNEQSNGNTI